MAGGTQSSNFPTTTGAFDTTFNGYDEVFVFKLNSNASKLIYSTFIGGYNGDQGTCIAIDSEGYAYVAGETVSWDFPNTTNAFDRSYNGGPGWGIDVFVLKLNQNGSGIIYSTFVGGLGNDWPFDLTLDSTKTVFVTGYTGSTNFPVTPGAFDTTFNGGGASVGDAFALRLDQTGSSLIFCTYLGGNNWDLGYGIKLDSFNHVYVTGWTNSTNFPTTPDAFSSSNNGSTDIILSKLANNGSTLLYSTYLGGSGFDMAYDLDLDNVNDAYLTGLTDSHNFPVTSGAYNQTLNGSRDCILAKFAFGKFINITSIQMLENYNVASVAYSRYCQYTFRVRIFDNMDPGDLSSVQLQLDPNGRNIMLTWNPITGKFSKQFDDSDFITLEQSSIANISFPWWIIDFNVTFNWLYPDEEYHDVRAIATSTIFSAEQVNVEQLYRVENDLVFNSPILLKGEDERTLKENDLVRGGELLNWTCRIPIYEDSIIYSPPESEFNITIWDEGGNSKVAKPVPPDYYPIPGEYLNVKTRAASATNLLGDTHIINLTGIPPECDKTNTSFTIRIDGENITYSDPIPNQGIWQTVTAVEVGIHITDHGGGEVSGSSVKYSISKDNGTTWSNWTGIQKLKSGVTVNPKDIMFLTQGKDNLIKWQANDSVGNGPVESDKYRIFVDTESVRFSNAIPTEDNISFIEEVEVGITISDSNSGVDALTIEYTVSEDNGVTWDDWRQVTSFENNTEIIIRLNLSFKEGYNNRIKWRARDLAGNGPTESKAYIIKVNPWLKPQLPEIRLWSPENASIIQEQWVTLTWRLMNMHLVNVTYDVYWNTIDILNFPKEKDFTNTSLEIHGLIDGETYYWTVVPKMGEEEGKCISGVWSFTVNTSVPVPKVTLIRPENGSILRSSVPTFVWSMEYEGNDIVTFDVYLGPNKNPSIAFPGHTKLYYSPESVLKDNITYYWQIVPWAGGVKGYASEIWSFTVKLGYIPQFELNLTLDPDEVILKPGSISSIRANVINYGEMTDIISLSVHGEKGKGVGAIVNEPKILNANSGDTVEFQIIVTATEDVENDELTFIVVATSGKAAEYDITYEVEAKLTVYISELEKPKHDKSSDTLHIWVLILIMIIIISIIVLIYIEKRKDDTSSTPETIQEEQQTAKPEAQIVAQPTIYTSQQLTLSTIPKPILEPSPTVGQGPTQKQILEAEQKPQLSPTELEKMKE